MSKGLVSAVKIDATLSSNISLLDSYLSPTLTLSTAIIPKVNLESPCIGKPYIHGYHLLLFLIWVQVMSIRRASLRHPQRTWSCQKHNFHLHDLHFNTSFCISWIYPHGFASQSSSHCMACFYRYDSDRLSHTKTWDDFSCSKHMKYHMTKVPANVWNEESLILVNFSYSNHHLLYWESVSFICSRLATLVALSPSLSFKRSKPSNLPSGSPY